MSPTSEAGRLPIWLILSVAINLLLVGAFAGRMLSPAPAPSTTERDVRAGLERAPRFGGAETRRAARQQLRAAWNETSDMREDLEVARANLKAAITAEPYVSSDVEEAFKAMREAEGKLQTATHTYLADALARTPASERAALADVMIRDRGRNGRRNRGNRNGDRRRLDPDRERREDSPLSDPR